MQGVFSAAPVTVDAQLLVNLGLVHRDGEWIPYWEGWVDWMRARRAGGASAGMCGTSGPACRATGTGGSRPLTRVHLSLQPPVP